MYLSVHLSVYQPTCLSASVSICLAVYLSLLRCFGSRPLRRVSANEIAEEGFGCIPGRLAGEESCGGALKKAVVTLYTGKDGAASWSVVAKATQSCRAFLMNGGDMSWWPWSPRGAACIWAECAFWNGVHSFSSGVREQKCYSFPVQQTLR